MKRMGLHLPLFYSSITSYGESLAKALAFPPEDALWATAALRKHGASPTLAFFSLWQAWVKQATPTEKRKHRELLNAWAVQVVATSLSPEAKEASTLFPAGFTKSGSKLELAWETLQKATAPVYYSFPVLSWEGTNNIYHQWLKSLFSGNLGISTQDHSPVLDKIKPAFQVSVLLALTGLATALLVSFFAGIHFSQNPGSLFTQVCQKFLYILDSIPGFLIALAIFAVYLAFGGSLSSSLPPDGSSTPWHLLLDPALLLSSLCIALFVIPHLSLQFTRGLIEQKDRFYHRTAIGKGLSPKRTLWRHALPNTLAPTLTIISEVIISLVAGVLVVEITFSLHGIGSLYTNSILTADYPVMVGLTLLLLLFRLAIVALTDFTLNILDPRMKTI